MNEPHLWPVLSGESSAESSGNSIDEESGNEETEDEEYSEEDEYSEGCIVKGRRITMRILALAYPFRCFDIEMFCSASYMA